MNDFTILHLSDLHLNGTGNTLSRLMLNLLDDIELEMKHVNNIILIVTGDFVHQANYEEYRDNVIFFFNELKKKIGGKIIDVYLVPGNHDKKRKPLDNLLMKEYTFDSGDIFYADYWQYVKIGYIDYLAMANEIYSIFKKDYKVENTYGVRVKEIDGKRICFISFDTAWNSQGGDRDERNLKLGKFQIDEIYKQYQKELKNGPLDLTIALGHHPLEWLEGNEETRILAELLSKNRLGVNVYISGHVHNRDVINWQNNRHSMTTLVSGLGWPDGSEKHPYPHVYSGYTFNLDLNSIDVYVRSSNEDNKFRPDFRIYTTNIEEKNRKIVMPINIVDTQAYFELGNIVGRSPKACYITSAIMESLQGLMHLIWGYRKHMFAKLVYEKYDYIIQKLVNISEDDKSQIIKIGKQMQDFSDGPDNENTRTDMGADETIFKLFETYLQAMCDVLAKLLGSKSRCGYVRVHFRLWNTKREKEDRYYQLVMGESKTEKSTCMMSIQEWGELLEEAFKARHPLVASVNQEYCKPSFDRNKGKNDRKNQWSDFLTAIPLLDSNIYCEQDRLTGTIKIERPCLTFGITVYDESDRKLLYELDYIRKEYLMERMKLII